MEFYIFIWGNRHASYLNIFLEIQKCLTYTVHVYKMKHNLSSKSYIQLFWVLDTMTLNDKVWSNECEDWLHIFHKNTSSFFCIEHIFFVAAFPRASVQTHHIEYIWAEMTVVQFASIFLWITTMIDWLLW